MHRAIDGFGALWIRQDVKHKRWTFRGIQNLLTCDCAF